MSDPVGGPNGWLPRLLIVAVATFFLGLMIGLFFGGEQAEVRLLNAELRVLQSRHEDEKTKLQQQIDNAKKLDLRCEARLREVTKSAEGNPN